MINVNKLVMLLRQTKLIPSKEINLMKVIAKKMNKEQKINATQKQFFNNIAARLSMEPMLNNPTLFGMTRKIVKKQQGLT